MKRWKFVLLSVISVILVLAVAVAAVYFFADKEPEQMPTKTEQTEPLLTEIPTLSPTEAVTQPITEPVTEIETQAFDTDRYLSQLSLEEKIAQMMLVSCHEAVDIESACSYGVGGLCLYSHSFESKSADDIKAMNENFQSLSKIPLLISTDEEGGTVVRVSANEEIRAVPFKSPSELFDEGGYELVKSDTAEKANLLLSLGINVNLAPVCDVPLSEDNYIYDRCFSLSQKETAEYTELVTKVMKEKQIGSTLKHFPGYGGSVDTHQSMGYDEREYSAFENGDFLPFKSAIKAGADSVLVSHNIVKCMDEEMPASLSANVHDILRNELEFTGVVITDDLVMEGIQQFTDGESAAVLAVKAGNDMIICNDYEGSVNAIANAVSNGEIEKNQIDESVKRILNWKYNLGILE